MLPTLCLLSSLMSAAMLGEGVGCDETTTNMTDCCFSLQSPMQDALLWCNRPNKAKRPLLDPKLAWTNPQDQPCKACGWNTRLCSFFHLLPLQSVLYSVQSHTGCCFSPSPLPPPPPAPNQQPLQPAQPRIYLQDQKLSCKKTKTKNNTHTHTSLHHFPSHPPMCLQS